MVFSQYHFNKMSEEFYSGSSNSISFSRCETMFENNFQCNGIKGHGGCCQDIDYGALGEQFTYQNGEKGIK